MNHADLIIEQITGKGTKISYEEAKIINFVCENIPALFENSFIYSVTLSDLWELRDKKGRTIIHYLLPAASQMAAIKASTDELEAQLFQMKGGADND